MRGRFVRSAVEADPTSAGVTPASPTPPGRAGLPVSGAARRRITIGRDQRRSALITSSGATVRRMIGGEPWMSALRVDAGDGMIHRRSSAEAKGRPYLRPMAMASTTAPEPSASSTR
ncbi:MAG: hypothetical protein JWM27_1013 [Gemmatimonadetes bacterium]|nr:hypothetical protein [Gemmatimonadota bacterium]